jgi:putative protease
MLSLLHASAGEGAEFARNLGCKRVVVARELSCREISKTVAVTGAEVEVFVHGALCVSYSGQCFSSEAWGGRSANRGQCAQVRGMPL